jgi:hypothetical protein
MSPASERWPQADCRRLRLLCKRIRCRWFPL